MPVTAEIIATYIEPGVLVKVQGIEGTVTAGLELIQQDVDPTELRWVVWLLPAGDNGLVVAACRGHGTEAGQAIGEDLAAACQMVLGAIGDCLLA